jgi:hypothetical protein
MDLNICLMTASTTANLAIAGQLALAGLTGLAVGIEREWSGHASGPHARFAGVRTFLLLGLIGGISGWLAGAGWVALGAALLGGGALLAVLAYLVASEQTGDRDGTTETATLLVLATGTLCGLGHGRLGSGIAAVAVLALAEKSRIQARGKHRRDRAARRTPVRVRAGRSASPAGGSVWSLRRDSPPGALTIVPCSGTQLPRLPGARTRGPTGIWDRRTAGRPDLLTAVTLNFSRQSRSRRSSPQPRAGVLACIVLIPGARDHPDPEHAGGHTPAQVSGAARHRRRAGRVLSLRVVPPTGKPMWRASPLRLLCHPDGGGVSVLLAVPAVEHFWGATGILASAAVIGLTDMDALTYSMARLAETEGAALAARAIAVGLLSNTLLKLGLVLLLGAPPFRKAAAPALLALASTVLGDFSSGREAPPGAVAPVLAAPYNREARRGATTFRRSHMTTTSALTRASRGQ